MEGLKHMEEIKKEKDVHGGIKAVATVAVSIGVSLIMSDILDKLMPENVKPVAKLLRKIGMAAIGAYAANAVTKNMISEYDETVQQVLAAVNEVPADDEEDYEIHVV
jgi:hypothetical protein